MNDLRQTPKHAVIADHYRSEIEGGRFKPGDQLPTLADLREEWGASTTTVRTAIGTLKNRGLVRTDQSGTFVADSAGEPVLDWETIRRAVAGIHDEVEAEFPPDVVLTMSGPGGFAALLGLSVSLRLVPVISAVTFPRLGDKESQSEKTYRKASKNCTWQVLQTGKWNVYLPKTLQRYAEGSNVLIFDDRVISGTTQALARDHLTTDGKEVKTAAMVVSTENTMNVDYYGLIIDDDYRMPWGAKRGRS